MKKYIILIFTFLVYGNIFAQDWSDKIVKVDSFNLPKSELYDKVKLAIYDVFVSGEESIQLDDKEKGVLIGKGSFLTPDIRNGFGTVLGSRSIFYKYTIEIKDNKYRITISDHTHEIIGRFDGQRPLHPSGQIKLTDKLWNKYKSECNENAEKVIQSLIAAINKPASDF
ncbi:MAG: DUF4468 domain-containing protein [Saprospiraceae bacterium]